MANTLKQLGQAELTSSLAAAYTVPGSTTTMVTGFWLCNTSASDAADVEVHLVQSGDSAGVASTILKYELAAGESFGFSPGSGKCVLETGATVQAKSSLASAVSLQVWGVEMA
jgi:hypothetical protein